MRNATSMTYGKIGSSSSRRLFSWSLSALELYTLIILGLCLLDPIHSFSTSNAPKDPTNNMAQENPMKVLVTGAAGQTGRLVLKKLEEDCRYDPKGLVRTERSAIKLIKGDVHCPLEHMIVSDVTSPTFEEDISSGLDGLDAMVICTSAVPRIRRGSLVLALLSAPWNMIRRRKAVDFRNFQFKWKHNGYPEKVDYHGQIKQIKLAKKLGMKHVVLVSSMGVTDPNHFLNNVGKDKKGNGNGDILLWKRKAEKYLVDVSNIANIFFCFHEDIPRWSHIVIILSKHFSITIEWLGLYHYSSWWPC